MIEARRPQVIPDHRGTLLVIEGAEFGCDSFTSVRLLDLPPDASVRLPAGRHVVVLIVGAVVGVNSEVGSVALVDLNEVIVADGDVVNVGVDGETGARVAILSALRNVSTCAGAHVPIEGKFVEVSAGDCRIESEGIDWALQSPFPVKRVYFTHSVGGGAERGGHAHRRLRQLVVAARGVIDISLKSGAMSREFRLDQPDVGVLIQPVSWREIAMHEGSHLMVLASESYDESEYIRDYSEFLGESS